jgi:argininosuccinate synthase
MRNLDITDTRDKLLTYAATGLISLSTGDEMPRLSSAPEKSPVLAANPRDRKP